jgi:hypothetical protein
MATESRPGLTGHLRSVTTTTLASLSGVLAALASAALIGTDTAAVSSPRQVFVVGTAILAQFLVHRLIGIDVDEYGVKDYLYIAFMTFSMWFISYAIILTAGVEVPLAVTAGVAPLGAALVAPATPASGPSEPSEPSEVSEASEASEPSERTPAPRTDAADAVPATSSDPASSRSSLPSPTAPPTGDADPTPADD